MRLSAMTSLAMVILLCSPARPVAADEAQLFASLGDFNLVSGATMTDCRIGYRTFGRMNDQRSNILVIPSWFNGTTRHLVDYGHIGPGALLNTDKHFVVAIDSLANGVSSSPSNSVTQPGTQFPAITVLDMVRSQHALLSSLGVDHVKGIVGISMGGMQTLQWLASYPNFMDSAVVIDATPRMTSYGLLQFANLKDTVRRMQRSGYSNGEIVTVISNLTQVTLYTPDHYRNEIARDELHAHLKAARDYYLIFDGDDYVAQIDAINALALTDDSDDSLRRFAAAVTAKVMFVANATDHMVNPEPARRLAEAMSARYLSLDSHCGHLGSTCERQTVVDAVQHFFADLPD